MIWLILWSRFVFKAKGLKNKVKKTNTNTLLLYHYASHQAETVSSYTSGWIVLDTEDKEAEENI